MGRRGQDKQDAATGDAPPIPAFQSVLAAPSAPELADVRRVSLAVTETTPVRDIIIELARKAEVDLELDPRISGGVILSVTDRPFIDVIERLCDLAELRYKLEKNVLRVEVDDPYLEQYRMDVLNQSRSSTGTVSSSTDASSASSAIGGGAAGGNNKSATTIQSNSDANFWTTIGENVGQILNSIQSRRGDAAKGIASTFGPAELADDADDTEAAPPAVPAAGQGPLAAAQNLSATQRQAAGAIEAEEDAAPAAPQAGGRATGGGAVGSSNFSVNPQAGIITVFATQRQHSAIEKYLRAVRNSVLQQVLIEAKILEISLNEQFRSGINWQAFLGPNNDVALTTNFSRSVVTGDIGTPTVGLAWSNSDQDLSIAAQLVNQFGTVRTLSSPRITVVNNQTAVLKVAENQIFFNLDVTREESQQTNRTIVTVDSEIKSVPVGLIMSVQPVADPVTKKISLGLRPSITRITSFVSDPAVAISVAQINAENPGGTPTTITSQIPVIETRELDSIVTMENGQTVVLGGLMQEVSENNREGLPGAMDIPILGQAASQNIRGSRVTELVIFIRATVVNDSDTIADEDIRLYKTFAPDPRPIAF
ncbi:MAG: hypothetical protein SFV19_12115 [Rhodospirillaceae bacterium]|nr:hypothetical protein [Rhodospirillaceae bacterium]